MTPKSFIIIDVGSTFTKAHFIREETFVTCYTKTTVEKPAEDVLIGVVNAIKDIEEKTKRKLFDNGKLVMPEKDGTGVDLFLATSSAGGGLQMVVAGLIRHITAFSAERAALSSGAIIMDVIAVNDGRTVYEKVDAIKSLRPDIILFAGGEDGGAISTVTEIAEILNMAKPKGKFIEKIPLVYAGNKDARDDILNTLQDTFDVHITENVRPTIELENPVPAREEIHQLFMEHVMKRAPGYEKLEQLLSAPIVPTPGAMFNMVKSIAKNWNKNLLCVDLGGATTDVFTVVDKTENRTVSANLGMSYSVGNVFYNAGIENIMRWIPFDIEEDELKNRIVNKMLNPTKLPADETEIMIEEAIAREAIRLALVHHRKFAEAKRASDLISGLGAKLQLRKPLPYIMAKLGKSNMAPSTFDIIIGSGGAISYGISKETATLLLIDAIQPTGVTQIALDNRFMLPHLGALAQLYPDIAWNLFQKFCYVPLATCIAFEGKINEGEPALYIKGNTNISLKGGEILETELDGEYEIIPAKGMKGKPFKKEIHGKVIIDARGRPLKFSAEKNIRIQQLKKWRKL
ncbi:MAG: glutamate mutase L [bacterium]|nr:glutamate mutase L [bacterium]